MGLRLRLRVRVRVRSRVRSAGGFTLIEVLVAALVLAIGILGAGAAQLAALRTRHQSRLMSDGVQLASMLADSMRANLPPSGAAGAATERANPYLQLRYDAAVDGAPAAAPQCLPGAGCSAVQMAEADIGQVRQALYAGFPGGRIAVCRYSGAGDAGDAGGALRWACAGGGDGGSGAPIVIKLGWRGRKPDGGNAEATGDGAGQSAPSVVIALPGAGE